MANKHGFKSPPIMIISVISAAVLTAGVFTVGAMNIFCTDSLYIDYSVAFSPSSALAGAGIFILTLFAAAAVFKLSQRGAGIKILTVSALALRLLSALFWKIEPESDFLITFNLAELLARTPFSEWGAALDGNATIYNTLWSAHMPFIIYQSLLLRIFPFGAVTLRIANAVFSWLSCILVSKTAKELFGKTAEVFALLIMCVNPVSVFFVPVLTNQHAALLMLTAAIWIYFTRRIKNGFLKAVLIGGSCAVSQLLRPEIYAVAIAAVVCVLYSAITEGKGFKKLLLFLSGAAVFAGLLFSVNHVLTSNEITRQNIYSGNLKYKLVMGLNRGTNGSWSEEDARLIYDGEALDAELKERTRPSADMIPLMFGKASFQFGTYVYTWSFDKEHMGISQNVMRRAGQSLMSAVCLIAAFALIFRRQRRLLPLYVTLFGYICAYALIEVQGRYNFSMIPVIILIACSAPRSGERTRGGT